MGMGSPLFNNANELFATVVAVTTVGTTITTTNHRGYPAASTSKCGYKSTSR